jgi:hypothetical protein
MPMKAALTVPMWGCVKAPQPGGALQYEHTLNPGDAGTLTLNDAQQLEAITGGPDADELIDSLVDMEGDREDAAVGILRAAATAVLGGEPFPGYIGKCIADADLCFVEDRDDPEELKQAAEWTARDARDDPAERMMKRLDQMLEIGIEIPASFAQELQDAGYTSEQVQRAYDIYFNDPKVQDDIRGMLASPWPDPKRI